MTHENLRIETGQWNPMLFGKPLRVSCVVCGKRAETVIEQWDMGEGYGGWIKKFALAHAHAKPKPLTAEEREKVRVRGIHRRGALRCGYGAVA